MHSFIRIIFLLGVLLWSPALFATHNRAGEIHIRQIGPLSIEATIITWTKASSVNADRDTLWLCWGDGQCQQVLRVNGPFVNGVPNGQILPGNIKYNRYIAIHEYNGPSTYRISMTDPNRNAGIVNVNPPVSDNVPFHIETVYSFNDVVFGGTNTTPYLLQPPIDVACIGKPFRHNPNAYDQDGDSLSYHLIVPLQAQGTPVQNYYFPNQIGPGINNILTLNENNGDILWNAPQVAGEYNIAFIIVSWRDGNPIDTTIRDMQILVENCKNNPPDVSTIQRICVIANDTVQFSIFATDPDSGNYIELTALGGPLDTIFTPSHRARLISPSGWQIPPIQAEFEWIPACEQISNQVYTVVFRAIDSAGQFVPQLADLQTVEIKVVGPPPTGVTAQASQGAVEVGWDLPYECEDAANNYFYAFSVWRREGSNPFPFDSCTPGLAGKGYVELISETRAEQGGRYYFKDTKVERGRTYCYRILGKFARLSTGGFPYNLVESLPSEEVCVQLPRDVPIITKASVEKTGVGDGLMQVCWSKPKAEDLDTIENPGPYRYQVLRAPGFNGGTFQPVPNANFVSPTFWQANDTCLIDNNLNTAAGPYQYRIDFFVNNETQPLGSTNNASSIFLNIESTDNTNILRWEESVPWNNYQYTIYRKNQTTSSFDSIGTSTSQEYFDRGLANGQEFCYYVSSTGTYSISGIQDPLLNKSQEACGIPVDTLPPCSPTLMVDNLCNGDAGTPPDPPYENTLRWNNVNATCPGTDDAVKYNLWFSPVVGQPFTLLTTINGANQTQYTHSLANGLAGCYTISAVDSTGNESALSEQVCVDNCPQYELPNTFTPNGDGDNERFVPFPNWRFIERVEFQVFNRWGNLVFETQDPALNWDGRNLEGKLVSDGTYFYICKVYERRVEGLILRKEILSGWIEVFGGG